MKSAPSKRPPAALTTEGFVHFLQNCANYGTANENLSKLMTSFSGFASGHEQLVFDKNFVSKDGMTTVRQWQRQGSPDRKNYEHALIEREGVGNVNFAFVSYLADPPYLDEFIEQLLRIENHLRDMGYDP